MVILTFGEKKVSRAGIVRGYDNLKGEVAVSGVGVEVRSRQMFNHKLRIFHFILPFTSSHASSSQESSPYCLLPIAISYASLLAAG